MKIRDYNGFVIDYNLSFKRFEAYKLTESEEPGHVTLCAETETQLTDKIDASVKRQEKAKKSNIFPLDVIYKSYNDIHSGKITSVAADGDVWITYTKNGTLEREKKTTKYGNVDFYKPTEANLLMLKEHDDKEKAITKLLNEMSAIRQSLTDRIDFYAIMKGLNA